MRRRVDEWQPVGIRRGVGVAIAGGEPVPLSPKVLDTLVALVESRDRVVTKDELLERIWSGTTVEEGGLTRNVSILRKTLGEKPDDHQFIVTVPGRGYRFVADLREPGINEQVTNLAPAAEVPNRTRDALPPLRLRARRRLALAGVAGLILSAVAYTLITATVTAPSGRDITSIAVLPLQNLSGDPGQEFFADGMTEALIGNLAPIRALRVVSRTSVMRFKGAPRPIPEIARSLNVDAVIEGSVQRAGDRVRVSVQLIHAPTDSHLWARDYERELTDVLKLQSEVARAVAGEIQVLVTADERARLTSAPSINPAAYQEFLLGQHYLWKFNEEDLARAIGHFEHAVRLDPAYAAAHAGLSHAWWWRGIWGAATHTEVESPSRAAAARALELDPGLAEAWVSRGRLRFGHDWDWMGAEHDFRRALAIDPNSVDAHFFSAMLCMAIGCFDQAIEHMRWIEQRDPLSAFVHSFFGRVLYRARRYDEAVAHFNRAIELEPRNAAGAYHRLADTYEAFGRYNESLAMLDKAAVMEPRSAGQLSRASIYARMGNEVAARSILNAARGGNPLFRARVHAALGDKDEAFKLLFRAIDERHGLAYIKTDPPFDSLHSDPRWKHVLGRMNLATEANARAGTDARD